MKLDEEVLFYIPDKVGTPLSDGEQLAVALHQTRRYNKKRLLAKRGATLNVIQNHVNFGFCKESDDKETIGVYRIVRIGTKCKDGAFIAKPQHAHTRSIPAGRRPAGLLLENGRNSAFRAPPSSPPRAPPSRRRTTTAKKEEEQAQ